MTLDQFAVFAAMVDEGSFAAAELGMGRAQSAMTYSVQKLEGQSGAMLLDRSAYRQQLNEAGRSLLSHARRVLAAVGRSRSQVEALVAGIEAEIRLVLPGAFPAQTLIPALDVLRLRYPYLRCASGRNPPTRRFEVLSPARRTSRSAAAL